MNEPETSASVERPRVSFWRKLGGGSLSISIIVHGILLALGLVWVFQVMPQKAPEVDFMPKGGGGGTPGVRSEAIQKKRATMTPVVSPRVAAKDVVSNFTLPEPDAASAMSTMGALGASSMAGGLGGSGSGGGRGDGKGTGFGSGMGPGLGGSAGSNPFGMTDANANALVGTFYNLNRGSKGETLAVNNAKQYEIIRDFVTGNWKDTELGKYEKAPKKLYQTKIYLPAMPATAAPSAFGVTPDSHPRWVVVYRGTILAAKTGKFRFVGAGDDTLAVRFNGRNVFDYGYIPATAPVKGFHAALKGSERLGSDFRSCPMEAPVTCYQYPTTKDWNKNLNGMAAGPEIAIVAGKEYPVEILISEGCGGLFAASLMIQESGEKYKKAANDAPILPLFRTDPNLPAGVKGDNAPPYDPQGPVWKVSKNRGFTDI